MAADSGARRAIKRVARRALGDRGYAWLQAVAMSRDIRSGAWHEPELELVPLAVAAGDTVLDIGANYGVWSWHLSRAVGPDGVVHAYEPVPFTVRTLRQVLRRLGVRNVRVHAAACGEAPGTLSLRVPLQTSGAISAGQAHFADRRDDRPGREAHVRHDDATDVECPVIALDDEGLGEVSFLKADIEGAEHLAFRGARRLIERDRPTIVVEINPWFLDGFGLDVAALVTPFFDLGYALHRYDGGRLLAVAVDEVIEDNYVLLHPSRAGALATLLRS